MKFSSSFQARSGFNSDKDRSPPNYHTRKDRFEQVDSPKDEIMHHYVIFYDFF